MGGGGEGEGGDGDDGGGSCANHRGEARSHGDPRPKERAVLATTQAGRCVTWR